MNKEVQLNLQEKYKACAILNCISKHHQQREHGRHLAEVHAKMVAAILNSPETSTHAILNFEFEFEFEASARALRESPPS